MNKRIPISLIFVIADFGSFPMKGQPNFIFILTDDHGWSQLSEPMDSDLPGAFSTYLESPNINRIGNAGMRFTNGYAPAPLCTPTRRSILCGTTPARSGAEFVSSWVPAEHLTIPKALKRANPDYVCAHFGKWGGDMISSPEESGYDYSDGSNGNADGGMPPTLNPGHPKPNHRNTPPDYIDNQDPKRSFSLVEKSIGFMQRRVREKKPFYLQVSFFAQHLSIVTTQRSLAKYEKKGTPDRAYTPAWAAMLDDLDQAVGRLLNALNTMGIAGNTYVIFMSDNGGRGTIPGGDQQRTAPNYPLSGAKHSVYEGGIRVPFMISGPGIAANSTSATPVIGYDLLPTLYELAGGRKDLPSEIDGLSLKPLFDQPTASLKRFRDALVFHRPRRGYSAIRRGNHKLVVHWKSSSEISRTELYDLSASPIEDGREISAKHPDVTEELKHSLLDYLTAVKAEKPFPYFGNPIESKK